MLPASKRVRILAKVATGLTGQILQEVQARETEQQRKSQQKTGSKGAPAKAQVCSDSTYMLSCRLHACTRAA